MLLALIPAASPSTGCAENAAGVDGGVGPFPHATALTDSSVWQNGEFRQAWYPQKVTTRIANRIWPRPRIDRRTLGPYAEIFGLRPQSISAKFVDGEIRSLTLLFLDSGTHFGYVPREQAVQKAKHHRESFHEIFTDADTHVRTGLALLAGGRGEVVTLGREAMLRQEVEIFQTGDLFARLHSIKDQLVKVTFFRDPEDARSWLGRERRMSDPRHHGATFAQKVAKSEDGEDRLLNEIPLFLQGDRAYCGVSALTMAMQYLGLDVDTEDYAAGAGIRYGSTHGSKIREIYSAAADELGFDIRRKTKFDTNLAQRSIDAGWPVIVWRRWSQERDYLHIQFARRRAKDSTLNLPIADAKDRDLWPDKDAYSHASVVTGYNSRRGEVIFTESWGEAVRNRRMRVAEMEATGYYTFYFSP